MRLAGRRINDLRDSRTIIREIIGFVTIIRRWREIRACNDNVCGESKGQNLHDSLLDLTFLIAATDPKTPTY